jgi:hypothetical protein
VIVSHLNYMWFVSLVTGLAAVYWIGIDSVRLRRALSGDRTDPAVKDRIFGSVIGLVVGVVGVIGVLHFLLTYEMI